MALVKRGGKREGSGRKSAAAKVLTKTDRIREAVAEEVGKGMTPMQLMLAIMRDEEQAMATRLMIAKELAPYVHPKLTTTQVSGPNNGSIPFNFEVKFVKPTSTS